MAPSQAKSMTSGMLTVPPSSLSFAKYMASGIAPTLQQMSATTWGHPNSHFAATSRVPSVQMGSVKGPGALLTYQQAAVAHVVPLSPLVSQVVVQSHSPGVVASAVASRSPTLACNSTIASSLLLECVAGIGTQSTSQRSGAASMAFHVSPYPTVASRAACGRVSMEAIPSALQMPVSDDLAQNGCHELLGPRKSYRSTHNSFIPEMLDGAVPACQVWEHIPPGPHREVLAAPVAHHWP